MVKISSSVGRDGSNQRDDILVIQKLLNAAAPETTLEVDGIVGPKTIAAIESFQRRERLSIVDGRVDPSGATLARLLLTAQGADLNALVAGVDAVPGLTDAGIIVFCSDGRRIDVRGGLRIQWIWIAPRGSTPPAAAVSPGELPAPTGFWDRWGGSVLNCGSAAAAGIVISMSAGTASPVAGAFAVNSALLCGTSLGKALAFDAWSEFEKNGGTAYRTWLTTETMLSLVDLLGSVTSAAKLLANWTQVGKLAKLQKAVQGRRVTKAELLRILGEIDPAEAAKIGRRATRGRVRHISLSVLKNAGYEVGSADLSRRLTELVSGALSLGGTPALARDVDKAWDIWLIEYEQPGSPG